jgi:enoyl-[acyl-carrier-protein] reductase (NADH)
MGGAMDPVSIDLVGRKGLVVGIANEHSLAWAAAQHFRNAGAELGITYRNDKAKSFVEPLARKVDAAFILGAARPVSIDDVIAAIDIHHIARDQFGAVEREKCGGGADIVDRDQVTRRSLPLRPL